MNDRHLGRGAYRLREICINDRIVESQAITSHFLSAVGWASGCPVAEHDHKINEQRVTPRDYHQPRPFTHTRQHLSSLSCGEC